MASPLAGLSVRWRALLVAAYLIVLLPVLMYCNVGLTPDSLVFVFLGAALIIGRPLLFLRDWGVFLLVVVLWQQTGPVAQWAGFPLHVTLLVDADRWLAQPFLHGALPQVWLQQHLFHEAQWQQSASGHWATVDVGHWQWYDVMSWAVYGLHFPEPLIVGFAIWLRTREGFRHFSAAFLVLAALAFVGYIIYPAVPPWMAGSPESKYHSLHIIPNVVDMFRHFNDNVLKAQLGHQYKHVLDVKYNLTAAMPSLHAAFPFLSALYLRRTFGRWGLLMLVYAAVVWFSVVYMGEHWVIDVLVGLACAAIAYALVEGITAAWNRAHRRAAYEAPAPASAINSRASR